MSWKLARRGAGATTVTLRRGIVPDYPVLIPTAEGAVGGIVSEPGGPASAALVLLPGYGRPARSGIDSFWAHTARRLAAQGTVVLRFDYSREGETLPIGEGGSGQVWKRDLDLHLLSQIVPWFTERVGDLPLLLAGSCSGGRIALDYAGRNAKRVAGSFLIVPYIRALAEAGKDGQAEDLAAVDPTVVDALRASLEHASSHILVGERDTEDVEALKRQLNATTHDLTVEVVPEVALHLLDRPQLQQEVVTRLLTWACLPLAGMSTTHS